MDGYARIIKTSNSILVRFEGIGHRGLFNAVMDRFRARFLIRQWDQERAAWHLPLSDWEQLHTFCASLFGPHGLKITYNDTTISIPRQLSFPLEKD